MSDDIETWASRRLDELIDLHFGPSQQGKDRAEIEALRAHLAGRCLSDVTHRDEEHRQSFCMLPAEHAPLAHDDCMGCTWTDAAHWQPQAVDRLADELARIADESQREGWDSLTVRRVVERIRRALDAQHGETREVPKMPEVDHAHIDPLTEFRMMRPDAEIIPVIL